MYEEEWDDMTRSDDLAILRKLSVQIRLIPLIFDDNLCKLAKQGV